MTETEQAAEDANKAAHFAAAETERLLTKMKMEAMQGAKLHYDELLAALDDMDASLRAGDAPRAFFCIFVWGQNRERILSGEETWEDQRIPEIVFGGGVPVHQRRP